MEYKNFWVWDADNSICVNSRSIQYFDIVNQSNPYDNKYCVYANLEKKSILIGTFNSRLLAKQKINDIISGAAI